MTDFYQDYFCGLPKAQLPTVQQFSVVIKTKIIDTEHVIMGGACLHKSEKPMLKWLQIGLLGMHGFGAILVSYLLLLSRTAFKAPQKTIIWFIERLHVDKVNSDRLIFYRECV